MGLGGAVMVSLERARQCIGRPIKHTDIDDIHGTVEGVDEFGDVMIRLPHGEVLHAMPHDLTWDDNVFLPIITALRTGTDYEGAQVEVTHDHDMNEYIFIGSPPGANDDGEAHMLYVGMPMMGRFHPVRPTADPWAAYFFEEVCGWAQP